MLKLLINVPALSPDENKIFLLTLPTLDDIDLGILGIKKAFILNVVIYCETNG